MDDLRSVLAEDLVRTYEGLAKKVCGLIEPLSETQLWLKPFAFGNSLGHLLLHLTGNLSYYVGTQIAQTGYVRDREREFTEPDAPLKRELLQKFEQAVAMVVRTIEIQSAEDWVKPYTANGAEMVRNRLEMVIRCASHLDHHVGQMQYLVFAVTN